MDAILLSIPTLMIGIKEMFVNLWELITKKRTVVRICEGITNGGHLECIPKIRNANVYV